MLSMSEYVISKAQPDNREHADILVDMWRSNLTNIFPGRFHWLYNKNPFGATITWFAAIKDKGNSEYIGSASVFPRKIIIDNKELMMGVAIDFSINKEHRLLIPALKLQKAIIANHKENNLDIVFAFPNKKAIGVFAKAGYKKIGKAQRWVKLIKTKRNIRRFVKNKFFESIIAFFGDASLGLFDFLKQLNSLSRFQTRVFESCDEKFDELWDKVNRDKIIVGIRTADFLNWRYSQNREQVYRFFCIFDSKTKVFLGYLVYYELKGVAVVSDLLVLDGEVSFSAIILKFSNFVRRKHIDSIEILYFGNRELELKLKKIGFFKRTSDRECMIHFDEIKFSKEKKLFFDRNSWFAFNGELDL